MKTIKAWVVDDDQSIRWVLERALKAAKIEAHSFGGGTEMLDALDEDAPDVLVTDIRMPGISGLDLLTRVRAKMPQLPVIIMTAHSDLDSAVAAYQGGAFEYLPKPFDVDDAVELVQRAARQQTAKTAAAAPVAKSPIVGEAPAMQEVFRAIGRLAQSHITVLITGESGTGKELVARALHEHSPRARGPFIAINTAAIPKDLMESEFFGHERGAFTGAQNQRKGRFEQADGGTLFLDEIGDMPPDLQTRLLRVLSDSEFYRVGGTAPIKVDVRVIAATHQHLEQALNVGRFREDLFHRLNVIRLRVPPLRERASDIPLLLRYFIVQAARDLKTAPKMLRPEVIELLSKLRWPGNVREVENLCRWLTVMAPGQEVHLEDLPAELRGGGEGAVAAPVALEGGAADWVAQLQRWAEQALTAGNKGIYDTALPQLERTLLEAALKKTHGHKQEAAALLGWGRNTLTRKLKELGMSEDEIYS